MIVIGFGGLFLLAIWCIITSIANLLVVPIGRVGTILLNLLLLIAGILILIGI